MDTGVIAAILAAGAAIVVGALAFLAGQAQGRATKKGAIEQARATIVAAALAQGVDELSELDELAKLASPEQQGVMRRIDLATRRKI